jgi:hypothetical protein
MKISSSEYLTLQFWWRLSEFFNYENVSKLMKESVSIYIVLNCMIAVLLRERLIQRTGSPSGNCLIASILWHSWHNLEIWPIGLRSDDSLSVFDIFIQFAKLEFDYSHLNPDELHDYIIQIHLLRMFMGILYSIYEFWQ